METELEAIQKYWGDHQKRTNETQSSASEKINIKQAAFCMYINGTMNLNVLFILRFSRLIGINPSSIRPSLSVIFGELKGKRLIDKLDGTIEAFHGGK